MSKRHIKCLISGAGAQNCQSVLCLNPCTMQAGSNTAALSYQILFVLSLQLSALDYTLKKNQPRRSWSALSWKENLFSLQYVICVNATTNGSLRNNFHGWTPAEMVFPFRNESGQKSHPSCWHCGMSSWDDQAEFSQQPPVLVEERDVSQCLDMSEMLECWGQEQGKIPRACMKTNMLPEEYRSLQCELSTNQLKINFKSIS